MQALQIIFKLKQDVYIGYIKKMITATELIIKLILYKLYKLTYIKYIRKTLVIEYVKQNAYRNKIRTKKK